MVHLHVSLRGAGFSCQTWRGAFRGFPRDALELARQSAGPRFKTTGSANDSSQRWRDLRRPPPSSAKDVATFWCTIVMPPPPASPLVLGPQIEPRRCRHVGLPTHTNLLNVPNLNPGNRESLYYDQWAALGIEPRTSRTQSENHTTRPSSQ